MSLQARQPGGADLFICYAVFRWESQAQLKLTGLFLIFKSWLLCCHKLIMYHNLWTLHSWCWALLKAFPRTPLKRGSCLSLGLPCILGAERLNNRVHISSCRFTSNSWSYLNYLGVKYFFPPTLSAWSWITDVVFFFSKPQMWLLCSEVISEVDVSSKQLLIKWVMNHISV